MATFLDDGELKEFIKLLLTGEGELKELSENFLTGEGLLINLAGVLKGVNFGTRDLLWITLFFERLIISSRSFIFDWIVGILFFCGKLLSVLRFCESNLFGNTTGIPLMLMYSFMDGARFVFDLSKLY